MITAIDARKSTEQMMSGVGGLRLVLRALAGTKPRERK
jgi:hypothetical protein